MFYGVTRKQQAVEVINDVCSTLTPSNFSQSVSMLVGTACAETAFCTFRDGYEKEGRGAYQFDSVRFGDVREYIMRKPELSEKINVEFGVDFNMTGFSLILDYSFLVSTIACRVGYMMIPEPLPRHDDLTAQAKYWKKYWNSAAGKGTPEHYIKMYRSHNPYGN